MKKVFFIILFISSNSFGATCKKLTDCASMSEKLTKKKFLYDQSIIPKNFELNSPIEMNKDNVEVAFSEALNVFGLSRIPSPMKDTIKIIQSRDINLYSDLPAYEASKTSLPSLPLTSDPVTVTYKGVAGIDTDKLAETISPLLSRYGKIVPLREGVVVVTDQAAQVAKILPLIQSQDTPLTKEEREADALAKKREHELEIARLKSSEMHEIGPHEH